MGEGARHPGRTGARFGRGLGRRLGAHHHRSRSLEVWPPVRALPQSRTHLDARFRHRLLPGPPRRSDRLRARSLRRRPRGADHHLRLVPGPRRPAQRRPRAGNAARPGRQARQARAAESGPSGHSQAGGGGRGAAAGGGEGGREGRQDAGDRRTARGPLLERLDPRRRRRHRRSAADRARAALPRSQIGDAGDPVQHEMGRAGGPGEVRLPGPEDADRPQAGGRSHRPPRRSDRPRQDPPRRFQDLRDARARRNNRRVPGGKRRHAQGAGRHARRPVRGPHRAGRALSPGPDGEHSDLLRPQARTGEARLHPCR